MPGSVESGATLLRDTIRIFYKTQPKEVRSQKDLFLMRFAAGRTRESKLRLMVSRGVFGDKKPCEISQAVYCKCVKQSGK